MNDDDYFLRGSASDWKLKNRELALKHIEECKRLLAPYLPAEAANDAQECEHQHEPSERLAHSLECVKCGNIVENPFKFHVERQQ